MINRHHDGLKRWIHRVFPERQIYHRSEGKVNYLSLTPRIQIAVVSVVSLFVLWMLYSSISVFTSGHILSSQNFQAQGAHARSTRLLSEARAREASARALLESRTADFSAAAGQFEQRLNTLKLLLDHVTEPTVVWDIRRPSSSGTVVMAAAAQDPEPRQSRPLSAVNRDHDNPPLARLAMLENQQNLILRQAEETSEERIENLRAVLEFTGIHTDEIRTTNQQNVGGPFVAMSDAQIFGEALDLDNDFSKRILRLTARFGEVDQLERTLSATPLGLPLLVEHRRTSKFGGRTDPITGRPAHHPGLDFGAFNLAPISATAPGKVSYAGWKSGYGRFVEIDHGHGFRTRYGHMAKLTVKRGQQVIEGQKIGLMGSSGRSTGVHLHYEVWHNGKGYDPEKFLKAGLYVQTKN